MGPESAGADPGPLCYGRGGTLAITDCNVMLGRVPADRFPLKLDYDAMREGLAEVGRQVGGDAAPESLAAGFIANEALGQHSCMLLRMGTRTSCSCWRISVRT